MICSTELDYAFFTNSGSESVDTARLLALADRALARVRHVRLIPQTHRLYGAL